NDSNVLVLPARFIDNEMALAILDQWLETEFDAGGRHSRRLTKIAIR
ncbi:MAG: RpiB/LacA/LacB family sugar-phosphate isomerase, partial [Alistipes sp.]|nr:RpiB/LacA/LacB family sugar-phosphate isomerase [Alistipes sp.]